MSESDQIMVRYLLGELSDAEQSALEERYFTNPQVFEQLVGAENELVDEYASGRLSPEVRKRLEQYYLAHPPRRERVKFAQALAAKVDRTRSDQAAFAPGTTRLTPWAWAPNFFRGRVLALSTGLVLFLLTVGGGWFLLRTWRTRDPRTQAARAAQEPRNREVQQPPPLAGQPAPAADSNDKANRALNQAKKSPPSPGRPAASTSVMLLLTAGGSREGAPEPELKLVIPSGTKQVLIKLKLKEGNYSDYRIVLQAIGGEMIFNRQGLRPRKTKSGPTFSIVVPARSFAAGDYMLTLRGVRPDAEVDDVSKSIFRVEAK
jgi:anti-sigma factor RsiW